MIKQKFSFVVFRRNYKKKVEKNHYEIIERLKLFLKNHSIPEEMFAEHVLKINKRKLRNVFATKMTRTYVTNENKKLYIDIENWLNNDEATKVLIKMVNDQILSTEQDRYDYNSSQKQLKDTFEKRKYKSNLKLN